MTDSHSGCGSIVSSAPPPIWEEETKTSPPPTTGCAIVSWENPVACQRSCPVSGSKPATRPVPRTTSSVCPSCVHSAGVDHPLRTSGRGDSHSVSPVDGATASILDLLRVLPSRFSSVSRIRITLSLYATGEVAVP
jgi:hypothetical protein